MTKKVYYEKRGNKYYPVAEYDSDFLDSYTKGSHLIMCVPGGTSRKFNVDPAYAPMIAAGKIASNAIVSKLHKASELTRTTNTPLTNEQKEAWEHFIKVMGDQGRCLQFNSLHDIAEAGVNSMIDEANKLMKHQAVKDAYDQFLLMCKLTQESLDE